MGYDLLHGDCLEVMRGLEASSIDAIVTDPPSGISFMGQEWDHDRGGSEQWIAWLSEIMREGLRVAKPGAHALVWALPRTSHWTGMAIERAGWAIRESVHHLYGSGFPKNLNVSKAIDDHLGVKRDPTGEVRTRHGGGSRSEKARQLDPEAKETPITAPGSPQTAEWEGWGTALKPGHEVWWLARKPIVGTVAENLLTHGVGGLNIDGCRIKGAVPSTIQGQSSMSGEIYRADQRNQRVYHGNLLGRWPTNVLFTHSTSCTNSGCSDDCPVAELEHQSGVRASGIMKAGTKREGIGWTGGMGKTIRNSFGGDEGYASRFFSVFSWDQRIDFPFQYYAKPSRSERDAGCDDLVLKTGGEATNRKDGSAGLQNPRAGAGRGGGARNNHPTVKPIALMQWLCRLITPPGGLILDSFMGSGTTGCAAIREGFRFIGIESNSEYLEIAKRRIEFATKIRFPRKPIKQRSTKRQSRVLVTQLPLF